MTTNGFKATILIKPLIVGFIQIKIIARAAICGDGVEKVLRVIPEGVSRSITNSTLIVVDQTTPRITSTLSLALPEGTYTDTIEISTTIAGDILGKALNNLEKLIRLPSGCGEQTLLSLVPDIAIWFYLVASKQLNPTLEAKLSQFAKEGYQNQLKYQRKDGGFSAFGNSDPASSTWLSAYSALAFYWSKDFIEIDPKVIKI